LIDADDKPIAPRASMHGLHCGVMIRSGMAARAPAR